MVRLGLAFALIAGPAAAGCFGPPLPKVVEFEAGQRVEILSHTATDLTYRTSLPDGSPSIITTRNGLFMVAASNHATTYSYTWVTPLPDLASLAPGFAGVFKADMVVEHASRSFFQSTVKVLRADTVTVQGCDYPVLVVERTDQINGAVIASTTLWLATGLGFSLRSQVTKAGKTQSHQVTAME